METKNFKRYNIIGEKDILEGIFVTNREGLHRRAFFSKLFNFDNMKKMLPGMRTIIKDHVNKLKAKVQRSPNRVVDIRGEFMIDLIDDVSTFLVLGKRTGNSIRVQGDTFMNKIKEIFGGLSELTLSPVNLVTFGLARKLGFDPVIQRMRKLNKDLTAACIKEYKRAFNSFDEVDKDESIRNCVVNMLVRHNKEVELNANQAKGDGEGEQFDTDTPISMQRIVDMILSFIAAGSDTTLNATTNTLSLLAKHTDVQDRIRKEIFEDPAIQNSEYVFRDLDSKPVLGAAMKESMRLVPPVPVIFWRTAVRKTKICGVTIDKGDLLMPSLLAQGTDPSVFRDTTDFNIDRFLKEGKTAEYPKIGKTEYMPFSQGQRACQGKNLAELMLKTILTEVFRVFKLIEYIGDMEKFTSDPGYGFRDNKVKLELI